MLFGRFHKTSGKNIVLLDTHACQSSSESTAGLGSLSLSTSSPIPPVPSVAASDTYPSESTLPGGSYNYSGGSYKLSKSSAVEVGTAGGTRTVSVDDDGSSTRICTSADCTTVVRRRDLRTVAAASSDSTVVALLACTFCRNQRPWRLHTDTRS